jgi:hypothetical protein
MCEKKSPDEYLFETHLDKIIDLAYWKSQIADSKTFSKEIRIMKRVSGQPCYSFYTWSDLTAEIFKIWDSPVTEYNTVKIKLQMMNHLINQVEFSYY